MSTDSSIFGDAGSTQNQTNTQTSPAGSQSQSPDVLATLLSGIKNERGEQKYRTAEDALKALGHSQNFIPQLQGQLDQKTTELQAFQAQTAELDALKETVAKLTQKLTEAPSNTGTMMSEDAIAEIVGRQLTANQKAEKEAQNKRSVAEALGKQFGDKAAEVFYGKAQEMGMSQDQINALAASAPQAVLTMFGVNGGVAHKQTINPPTGTVNTAGFSNTTGKSMIGRETHQIQLGASHKDTMIQLRNAQAMVEEMQHNGMSVHDLTDPATFFKHFG